MNKYLFTTIVCSLIFSISNAEAQSLNDRFESNKKAMDDRMDIYRIKVINGHTNLRKGMWKRFDDFKSKKSSDEDIHPVTINYSDTTVKKIKDNNNHNETFTISFYSNPITIHYVTSDIPDFNINDNNQVADAWDYLHTGLQSSVLKDCLYYKEKFRLCDWAYLNLIMKVAKNIYSGDKAIMLASYLFSESGYEMSIGRSRSSLIMFVSTKREIYNQSCVLIDDKIFFPAMGNGSYDYVDICVTPNEGKVPLSLYIFENQKLFNNDSIFYRSIDISDLNDKSVELRYGVNVSLLDFYENYPTSIADGDDMTRWTLYAETPINDKTRNDIYMQFADILKDKSELDATNFLLKYVQTKFRYKADRKTDSDDFFLDYNDRVFFAEETLTYLISDSEDRSILFSHLVRDLLGLDVALLYTKGHLSTAVCFNDEVTGESIIIDGRKFIICDPSCPNGAPVGWSAKDTIGCKYILLKRIDYDADYTIVYKTQKGDENRSIFPVCIDGKWGYENKHGEIVVECIYDNVSDNAKYGDLHCYTLHKDDEITICTSDVSLDNSGWIWPHYYGYIPLDLQSKDSIPLYYDVIVKDSEGWYMRSLIVDGEPDYELFKPYDMENVTYDLNVYCESIQDYDHPQYYIILKHIDTNKYGVILLNSKTIHIPFIYDAICFDGDDKSKVRLSLNGKTDVIKLKDYNNFTIF